MPLLQSSSKEAFKENIKTEMKSKPQKQAVAIAYSVKRKNQREHKGSSDGKK